MSRHAFLVIVLLVVFFTLSISSALKESLTFDERPYIDVGIQGLTKTNLSLEPYNPPFLLMLMTLPHVLQLDKMVLYGPLQKEWITVRTVNVVLGVFILLATYSLARRYINRNVALLSLLLLAFEPNFLAHSHYITHDVGLALFFLLSYAALLQCIQKPITLNFVRFGFWSGFALASKVASIPYLTISAATLILFFKKGEVFRFIYKNRSKVFVAFIVSLVTLWGTYFFKPGIVIEKDARPNRISEKILSLAKQKKIEILKKGIEVLQNQPLPLGGYAALVKNSLLRRKLAEKAFFFGEEYEIARPYFMPVIVFLKTSLPVFILASISIVEIMKKRKEEFAYFLIPVLAVLFSASLLRLNPQVRYVLPLFPFLSVLAAYGLYVTWRSKYRMLGALLLIWYVARTVSFFPHFIAFANELAGNRNRYYQVFSDSNLDWGQSFPDLKKYVSSISPKSVSLSYFGRDDPEIYGLHTNKPLTGNTIEELCDFYQLEGLNDSGLSVKIISITNWYICGYYRKPEFSEPNIRAMVGSSFLMFGK